MNQEDKLNILKDILLTDEREYASNIQKKIELLEETINKQKKLSRKVTPIIDEKLEEFVDEIPKTLGPVITKTLKEEIKNSQEAVVEALFPIIGKMIKRYIQSEMKMLSEQINSTINNTFSFESIKRKIKSKVTGVSEADLIIQDALNPRIEQLMVIEKGSGLLISEYTKTNNIEEDMVAGMLTAIKSFIEDAFQKENEELQSITYDTYHIHVQNFSRYYIAAVISGTFNAIYKNELEDKLLDFAKNHINKDDLENKEVFSKKLKVYFDNEDF